MRFRQTLSEPPRSAQTCAKRGEWGQMKDQSKRHKKITAVVSLTKPSSSSRAILSSFIADVEAGLPASFAFM